MSEPTSDGERFSLDLPFWINGTLDADARRWMEDYLRTHPECEEDVTFARLLQEHVLSIKSPTPEDERIRILLQGLKHPTPPLKRLGRR